MKTVAGQGEVERERECEEIEIEGESAQRREGIECKMVENVKKEAFNGEMEKDTNK